MNPALSPELVGEVAIAQGVCARPVISRVTDLDTGEVRLVPIWCGSTREDRCPACADRARRLRMQQCREGWHLDTEPEWQPTDDDEDQGDEDQATRPTTGRRGGCARPGAARTSPTCPGCPAEDRTIGRVFTAPDGKTYRPSMFVTLTLGSYGRVTAEGVPVDPERYDYRRAALDALHFPKLVDRFWQNLRRCAGYQVQYFAAIEAQRRLAPHLHAAIRGAIPRQVLRGRCGPPPTTRSGGPPTTRPSTSTGCPMWTDRGLRRPDHRRAAADLGRGARRPRRRPRRAAGARGAVRGPGRHPGPDRRDARRRAGHRLPVQVPHQVHRRHPRRQRRVAGPGGAHRPAGRRGPLAALCADVCELAALRHPARRRPGRDGARALQAQGARPRPTSASAAAGCSCPASGPARPSPATRPTGPPWCGPPSRKPGSTPTTTTSCPWSAATAAGRGNCSAATGSTRPPTRPRSPRRSPPGSDGGASTRRPRRPPQLGRGRRRRRAA